MPAFKWQELFFILSISLLQEVPMSFGKSFTKIRFGKIREKPEKKYIQQKHRYYKSVPPLGTPIRKSYRKEEGEDALEKLNIFLDEECPEQVYFLTRVWTAGRRPSPIRN